MNKGRPLILMAWVLCASLFLSSCGGGDGGGLVLIPGPGPTPENPLDTNFGTGGIVKTAIGSNTFALNSLAKANALAIQSDGKLVTAGGAYISQDNFALARYNTNGTLDASFGTGGIVTTAIGVGHGGFANALAIQTDGKLVAAGYAYVGTSANDDFALARYNTDGTLDASFGTGGIVTTAIGTDYDAANGIAIQTDGKIVAAGTYWGGPSTYDFAVTRYCANGHLDDGTTVANGGCGGAGFGTGGKVTTAISTGWDRAHDIKIQTDGKIVVAGYGHNGNDNDFALVRYCANGHLDDGTAVANGGCGGAGFGTGGIVMTAIGIGHDEAHALVVQSDGKLVAGGSAGAHFALARYNTNGTLDASFGTGGIVLTDFGSSWESINSLAIQTDGKIVAGGCSEYPLDVITALEFAVARYNTDGTLDTSFGTGGKVTTKIDTDNIANSLAIQPDGKIVAAGYSNYGYDYYFTLVRYK